MTATTPGYLVTITAFLPADPQAPREMAIAAAMLDSLDEQLEAMGLQERIVTPRFVQRHKIQSPSAPAAPDPAEPTQPLDHAPAGPTAAGASTLPPPVVEESGTAAADTSVRAGAGGDQCQHPADRRRRYTTGVFCACGAGPLAEEAA